MRNLDIGDREVSNFYNPSRVCVCVMCVYSQKLYNSRGFSETFPKINQLTNCNRPFLLHNCSLQKTDEICRLEK